MYSLLPSRNEQVTAYLISELITAVQEQVVAYLISELITANQEQVAAYLISELITAVQEQVESRNRRGSVLRRCLTSNSVFTSSMIKLVTGTKSWKLREFLESINKN